MISLESDRPAASDTAVVFACDEAYARYALFAAARIDAVSPARDFDICLCSMEPIQPVASLAALGIRHCRVDTGGVFGAMNLDARRTEASYLRLALPAAFAGQYRRLLYLDADVFPQGGDFSRLLRLACPTAVAAVRDNSQWRTPGRRPDSFKRLGLAPAPYFNSGVLLIDVERFNADRVLDRCLAFAGEHPPERIGLDQDLLNAVLHGDWSELGPVWNWQYTWASRLTEAMVGANILHFIGPRKPWKHDGGELPLKFRRAYRDFFAVHFPDAPIGPDGTRPQRNRVFQVKMLAKHLVAVGKMGRYLDRFEDDFTVAHACAPD